MTMNNTTGLVDTQGNVITTAKPLTTEEMQARLDALQKSLEALLHPVTKKQKFPRGSYGKIPVKDTETGVVYGSQAECAKKLFLAQWELNHFYIYEMYKLFPGRFAKIIDGKEFLVGEKPVAKTA